MQVISGELNVPGFVMEQESGRFGFIGENSTIIEPGQFEGNWSGIEVRVSGFVTEKSGEKGFNLEFESFREGKAGFKIELSDKKPTETTNISGRCSFSASRTDGANIGMAGTNGTAATIKWTISRL